MFNIPDNIGDNMWDSNPHLIYLKPFSLLYSEDKSKDKKVSSNILWCVTWLQHPDEEKNKYYRLPHNEKVDVCLEFESSFDPDNDLQKSIIEKYPELCLSLIELAYKQEKDQLYKMASFLNAQDITMENAESLFKLKAQLPKIYADFAKTDKEFEKTKSTQRVFGGRAKTPREKNLLQPND